MNTNPFSHKESKFRIKAAFKEYPWLLKILCIIILLPIIAAPIVLFVSVFAFDDPNANILAQLGIFMAVNSYSFILVGFCLLSVFLYTKYHNWIISIAPFIGLGLIAYGMVWYFNDGPVNMDNVSPIDYRLFRGTPCEELAKSVEKGNVKAINNILCDNPKLADYKESKYHQTVMFQAIANRKYKSLEAMLRSGANPNVIGHDKVSVPNHLDTPLRYVCGSFSFSDEECLEYVKLLLQYGADINSSNLISSSTPLSSASGRGHLLVVKYLLDNGADIDVFGHGNFQPLKAAIVHRHYEVAMELLEHNSNPDYRPFDDEETVREYLKATIKRERIRNDDVSEMTKILNYIQNHDRQNTRANETDQSGFL